MEINDIVDKTKKTIFKDEQINKNSFGLTDKPAENDDFEISGHIKGLASFISKCQTPMTIAVQGAWGSGKTSFVNLVIKELEELDKNKILNINFNAWQYSQFESEDNLAASLISVIISKIQESRKVKNSNIKSKDEEYHSRFKRVVKGIWKFVKGILLFLFGIFRFIANFFIDRAVGSTNTAQVNELFNCFSNKYGKKQIKAIAELKDDFQKQINSVIKSENKKLKNRHKKRYNYFDKVLIFIDDLDRLQPIRAIELLEVLKNFLDCEYCVFLLAVDNDVVVSGIKSKYGDISTDKGKSFFDKMIQVPFNLPQNHYKIESFVRNELINIPEYTYKDDEIQNIVNLIEASIGTNPRSIKRLFNTYLLSMEALKNTDNNTVKEKENLIEFSKNTFFAILCFQLRFDSLYSYIVNNRNDIKPVTLFNELSSDDNDKIAKYLEKNSIDYKDDELDNIREFIKSFNDIISIEKDINWEMTIKLLGKSSMTASNAKISNIKEKDTFYYNNKTYIARGAKGVSLNYLALQLVKDYLEKNKDITADAFLEIINEIPAGWKGVRDQGLSQVCKRSESRINNVRDCFFLDKDDIINHGGTELVVTRGWPVKQLNMLINILGFNDKVSSNLD